MMAKKAVEVNMQEGQIRWPKGQWGSVLSCYCSGSVSATFQVISLEQVMCRGQSMDLGFRQSDCGSQSPATAARACSTDSASPRRTGPNTNAGTLRSGASERLVARRGNSVR
jgi:hypothetical protein